MADAYVLEIPEQITIAPSTQRVPQPARKPWPAGTSIVSADSHLIEQDYWHAGFPADKKEQAPRMSFEGGRFEFRIGEKSMTPPAIADFLCRSMECTPGLNDIQARLKDLDVEGVEKELVFPQRLFGLFMFGEMQNREEVFGLYNEAIARRCAEAPDRLYPVMVPNYWDMTHAKASLERCKALDARGLMVPLKPGKDVDGKSIHYNHGKMDPLYESIAASGIPLIFHIGEAIPTAA